MMTACIKRNGQSTVEYACVLAIMIAAVIIMSVYIKRGIQGHWHSQTSDLFPEQFDPVNTTQVVPLSITVSNYNLNIKEGSTAYTKKSANWIGSGWQIWSK